MSYFPDLCALTPEILREHSLSFSSYLTLFRLSGQSGRCRPVTRNCIVLILALLCVETYSVLCLYHLIIPGILADVPSCHRDYL